MNDYYADLGVARQIATLHRPSQRYGYEPPRLVRRAGGTGIGLLIGGVYATVAVFGIRRLWRRLGWPE